MTIYDLQAGSLLNVLDNGYVRLIAHLGSDLSVVNAARASFLKESETFDEKDERLVEFLGGAGHTEPFRHAFITFEVKAPLMVARQWYRYAVASNHGELSMAWSEASRRYVTLEPEFYIPAAGSWRSAPENKKQGSGAPVDNDITQQRLTHMMNTIIDEGLARYRYALDHGVAVEQARAFLPAYSMYTVWRWSCSLQSVLFFLGQRMEDDAQWEIQQYAKVVSKFVKELFPVSYKAFLSK